MVCTIKCQNVDFSVTLVNSSLRTDNMREGSYLLQPSLNIFTQIPLNQSIMIDFK